MLRFIKTKHLHLYSVIIFLSFVILYFGYYGIRTYLFIRNGNQLASKTIRYEQQGNDSLRILVLGDSLAYGVGASSPEASFAGQIGVKYKDATIVNKARIGEDISSLSESINTDIDRNYDVAYVIIGGNDISRYSVDINNSQQRLADIYKTLGKRVTNTFFYTTINFDRVAASPPLLKDYYSRRSREISQAAMELSQKYPNVRYIDAFSISKSEYKRLQASDGFHLNDLGVKALITLTYPD